MNVQVNPTINTFTDLIFVLNTQPEWRRQLAEALFPDFNIHKTLESLAETNRLLREDITLIQARLDKIDERFDKVDERFDKVDERFDRMDERLDKMDERFDKMDERFDKVEGRLDNLEDTVGDLQSSVSKLKGDNYEFQFVQKINSILGIVLRKGRDARNQISDHLDELEELGELSDAESSSVLSADLLWQGVPKKKQEPIFVVGEVSWLAELHDIERAAERAQIVTRAGLEAVPVVAGQKWTYEALEAAKEHRIVRVREFSIERESWLPALDYMRKD